MATPARELNFGAGMPDPATFPAQALGNAAARVVPRIGKMLARYPDQRGLPELRAIAAERFEHNHEVRPPLEHIVLTNGSMQGLMLAAQGLAKRGDAVIVEEFTYSGTLRVFRQYGLELVPVPLDDQGMRVDVLADVLRRQDELGKKPAFIYTIASYQNPSGTTLPLARRQRLIELARQHGVKIVEDDCYADVSFVKQSEPALYKLAEPGEVMYIGSFSKILGPGVRLGYFIAPEPMTSSLLQWKTDGGTSNLSAMIVAEYFKENLWAHIEEGNTVIKQKRDTLLAALEREFAGTDVSWTHPDGGLFLWVKLPEEVNRARIQELAKERGIIYATGQAFHSLSQDVPYLRLAFGYIANEDISEGVRQLAECVRAAMPTAAAR